jgi:hypothetical protein
MEMRFTQGYSRLAEGGHAEGVPLRHRIPDALRLDSLAFVLLPPILELLVFGLCARSSFWGGEVLAPSFQLAAFS